MTNEERCRSRLWSQFGCASASFFSSFFFFSLISFNLCQCWTLEPFTHPSSCLFIEKDGIRGHGSSPKRAVASTWSNPARQASWLLHLKLFGGPGEPEASLGEPRSRKLLEMTLLPLHFGIFRVLDQNIEWSSISHCNWRLTLKVD